MWPHFKTLSSLCSQGCRVSGLVPPLLSFVGCKKKRENTHATQRSLGEAKKSGMGEADWLLRGQSAKNAGNLQRERLRERFSPRVQVKTRGYTYSHYVGRILILLWDLLHDFFRGLYFRCISFFPFVYSFFYVVFCCWGDMGIETEQFGFS